MERPEITVYLIESPLFAGAVTVVTGRPIASLRTDDFGITLRVKKWAPTSDHPEDKFEPPIGQKIFVPWANICMVLHHE